MVDERFPPEKRIRFPAEYDRVYKNDAFAADDVLVVRGCWNDRAESRLGTSISRAVGNAVMRNRWKRRIREAFRQSQNDLPTGLDIVVRPKRGATPEFDTIQKSLVKLAALLVKRLKRQRS
jgi:ribonuclease P protein component